MISLIKKNALILVIFIHAHVYLVSYLKIPVPASFFDSYRGYFHPAAILAAISGYLLFKNLSDKQQNLSFFIQDKYIKRIKSIFIPYFFWITVFFIVSNAIIYFFVYNNYSGFANKFHNLTITNYLKSFFFPEIAVAKHLWYLNNLLFAFIISPFILIINKNKIFFFLLLFFISFYYYFNFYNYTEYIINYRFIMFFIIGSFLGLHKKYVDLIFNHGLILITLSLFVFLLVNVYTHFFRNDALLYVFNDVFVTAFVFLISFYLIKFFVKEPDTLYNRSNHFLLYIIHPFLLSLICKIAFFNQVLITQNYLVMLLYVVILSFMVIKLNYYFYLLLYKFSPKFTHHFL